ncbi:S-adenosyl-L-methionine-dependent methyltransferase [Ramaria rubella]|nr:S-adenosyl-L-methionine-dependent methyltransferase [Ramaria rubella]
MLILSAARRSVLVSALHYSLNASSRRGVTRMSRSPKSGLARSPQGSPLSARPEKRPRLDLEEEADGAAGAQTAAAEPAVGEESSVPNVPRKPKTKKRKEKRPVIEPYSSDDVLYHDVVDLLKTTGNVTETEKEWDAPIRPGTEVELVVSELSSTGDSLCILPAPHPPWVVAVPFALPGEHVRARIYRSARLLSFADLLSIESSNDALRDMNRVKCKYFGKCAGCQYQMLSYEDQLEFKRKVVDKAYQNFSSLPADSIPLALPTIPSPNTYGYRTKITPHFDVPPKQYKSSHGKEWELRIGFGEKGRRGVIDIEECPIATPALNEALGPARQAVQGKISTYKRGATLLLRDSLEVPAVEMSTSDSESGAAVGVDALSTSLEKHVCISDHKATVRERVGAFLFEYPAGSFFQNNNAVLEPLTTYVRDAALGSSTPGSASAPTHLVDAYCGSGLFAITLSPHFTHIAGVEISTDSIHSARHNATLNHIPASKCTFHAGTASAIFASVQAFPPARTVIVIDPPRKGCDGAFIEQLLAFGAGTVVYVSCNVHTQARDVGQILGWEGEGGGRYRLESLRGFDLFPQTAHVESVAVLRRQSE